MAESEAAEGEVMPNRLYQTRVVGEKNWTIRPARSAMAATIAESISATVGKVISDVKPMVIEVRDITLPYDVTTLDVVCLVQFMVTARDPFERN